MCTRGSEGAAKLGPVWPSIACTAGAALTTKSVVVEGAVTAI